MPFSATINLGTVGVAITSVKLYGCTGNSGTDCTGCTVLTGYENVSVTTFPLLVSGIPNGVRYIQAEALGACSADLVKQCISISGIPGPTATPNPTNTPTPTGTSAGTTPNPTSTQTPTPTPTPSPSGTTPGATPAPTNTPTPTPTVTLPGCGSIVSGTFTGSTMNNYDDIQLNFAGVTNGSIISFTCTANNRPNNISIRTGLGVIESTGWFGNSSGYDPGDYWYPTEGTGPITLTITYDNTKTYYIDTLTAPALDAPYEESDYWEVNISCGAPAPTPSPSPSATPNFYPITVNLQGMVGENGNLQVYQSSDGVNYQSSLTLTSNDGDYASSGFNGTPGYWYYLIVARTSGGGGGMNDKLNLYTQVNLTDFSPGPISNAWCASSSNTLQSDPFQLPNPVQTRQSIIFYGGLNEGCL